MGNCWARRRQSQEQSGGRVGRKTAAEGEQRNMAVPMKYLYHAVRFGRDNVRSCIFLQWPDAEPHVLGYNDGTAAASVPASQCRTYDDLEDAVIYLGHDPFSVKAPEDTGPRCYHAVRVGRGVRSCIFLNWHDASQHVVCVEAVYQTFEDPAEALVYLGGDPNPPFNRHRFIGSVHGVANADATLQLTETRKRRREDGNNSGEEEHSVRKINRKEADVSCLVGGADELPVLSTIVCA